MAVTEMHYAEIEESLRALIVLALPDRITDSSCRVGDIDGVFDTIRAGNDDITDGCVLDFAGGTSKPREKFGNINWAWVISGIYMIRYHVGIETDLRYVVSKIACALQENPRLDGNTPKAYMTELGDPIIGKLNDISFYFIPFFVEALDQSMPIQGD